MTFQEIAQVLEHSFKEVQDTQNILAERVSAMVLGWDCKLSPIKATLEKYGIKYTHKQLPGETSKGVIVGSKGDYLLVLSGKTVKPVDPNTDEYSLEEPSYSLRDFVKWCDLRMLKIGFESVVQIDTIPAMHKNNELSAFLKENKDLFAN